MSLNGLAGKLPGRAILEETGDQGRMHGMTGALGDHVAFDAAPREREIPDQIENFVPYIFIRKAQRAILRAVFAEDDGILRAGAADQAHVAEALLVSLIAEGACRCDISVVGSHCEVDRGALAADGGRKINGVVDAVTRSGINPDELVAFANLDLMED